MSLHWMKSVTIGVPSVPETVAYYVEFGLSLGADGWLSTRDGGRQLRIVPAPTRRVVQLVIGADDQDDLLRIERQLDALDVPSRLSPGSISAIDPTTGVEVTVEQTGRVIQSAVQVPAYNSPGLHARGTSRAPAILRESPVRPRKLGHVVIGSTDQPATQRFFTDGIGLKISDVVPGHAAFMRCSIDHHNILVVDAPVTMLHHTSWQVDDVDEIGRGATHMLEGHPERHIWGLGRHHIGSNFFWYLKDPAGNFSEYYSDLDCIVDEALWKPEVWGGAQSLYSWGPPPPASFIHPEDLTELMAGIHQPS